MVSVCSSVANHQKSFHPSPISDGYSDGRKWLGAKGHARLFRWNSWGGGRRKSVRGTASMHSLGEGWMDG